MPAGTVAQWSRQEQHQGAARGHLPRSLLRDTRVSALHALTERSRRSVDCAERVKRITETARIFKQTSVPVQTNRVACGKVFYPLFLDHWNTEDRIGFPIGGSSLAICERLGACQPYRCVDIWGHIRGTADRSGGRYRDGKYLVILATVHSRLALNASVVAHHWGVHSGCLPSTGTHYRPTLPPPPPPSPPLLSRSGLDETRDLDENLLNDAGMVVGVFGGLTNLEIL